MRTITSQVYKFDELSDSAKEKAREWFREGNLDYDWWDCCYDDFARVANILGIDLRQKPVKLMNGSIRYDPAIYFSGFYSQGDGAYFEGTYSYRKGSRKAIREYAPQDNELHSIADSLYNVQRRNFYKVTANISTRGRDNSISVEVDECSDSDAIREAMQDFADWMFKRLRDEYEYQQSDEQVDESIRINEYEFDVDGHRA